MLLSFSVRVAADHLFGKELLIRLTVLVFRGRWSNFVCVSFFPFGIEGGMWDVIVLIPDHCLSLYFPILPTPLALTSAVLTRVIPISNSERARKYMFCIFLCTRRLFMTATRHSICCNEDSINYKRISGNKEDIKEKNTNLTQSRQGNLIFNYDNDRYSKHFF